MDPFTDFDRTISQFQAHLTHVLGCELCKNHKIDDCPLGRRLQLKADACADFIAKSLKADTVKWKITLPKGRVSCKFTPTPRSSTVIFTAAPAPRPKLTRRTAK